MRHILVTCHKNLCVKANFPPCGLRNIQLLEFLKNLKPDVYVQTLNLSEEVFQGQA